MSEGLVAGIMAIIGFVVGCWAGRGFPVTWLAGPRQHEELDTQSIADWLREDSTRHVHWDDKTGWERCEKPHFYG